MRRWLVAGLLALASAPASAQPAFAIGKPLPTTEVPAGTVTVKVIAGSGQNVVAGADVTLLVNATPRQARTDSSGRATFKDLPAGATLQAKIVDEDKKDVVSEPFPLPASSGVRVMLSTRAMKGGGGAAPFAGGGAGGDPPMDPIAISGQPRGDGTAAPGTYSVRVVHDGWKPADNAVGLAVTLVGYVADGSVTVATKPTDAEGRAIFADLDRSGATAYFAMAQLPRANGTIDRLYSQASTMPAEGGVKLVLSGARADATVTQVDELGKIDNQEPPTADGKVRVTALVDHDLAPEMPAQIALIDAATRTVVAKAAPALAAPDPTSIMGGGRFDPNPDMAAHNVRVVVHGGPGTDDAPLPNVGVRLIPAAAANGPLVAMPGTAVGEEQQTDATGSVDATNPSDDKLTAVITVNGKQVRSQPFELAKSGGVLAVEIHWEARGRPEVLLDAPAGKVLFAETVVNGQAYRSLPFQPIAGRGTRLSLFVVRPLSFAFSLNSQIDDEFLAVRGRFTVSNNWLMPYRGDDGVVVPLPRHFKGAIVAAMDQADVAVDPSVGFRVIRPIAPGQRQFHGGFSLPIDSGTVRWELDLPYGAVQSGLEILEVPGMSLETPPGVEAETARVPQGTFRVLPSIEIHPGEAMVMTISGLPAVAEWKVWLPRIIGAAALATMLGGLYLALFRRSDAKDAARAARKQELLDELVALDRVGKSGKRREAVLAELENLWD